MPNLLMSKPYEPKREVKLWRCSKKIRPPFDKKVDVPLLRQDQRKEERIASHAPLIFTYFSTRFHREQASMTFNHSRVGMCMETSEPCKPGSILFIRLSNAKIDEVYQQNRKYLRTTTLAEVKWCREHQDKFGNYYQIGVKYF